jgi:hypothetical protein
MLASDVPATPQALMAALQDEAARFDAQAQSLRATNRSDARTAAEALERAAERLRAAAEWIQVLGGG